MFTGIVEETGRVNWLRRSSQSGLQIQVSAPLISRGLRTGESVALNGCCLTVASHRAELITFNVLQETLDRTNLHRQRPGTAINLERALPADGRLGGHFVQGHVDCTSRVESFAKKGDDYRLEVVLPAEWAHLVVFKGSIAVNGISLTVASLNPGSFTVWIIPHTREQTNLHDIAVGDLVNLEFDVLAKYVERILGRAPLPPSHLTDRDLS
jgi:riboflavin synthase